MNKSDEQLKNNKIVRRIGNDTYYFTGECYLEYLRQNKKEIDIIFSVNVDKVKLIHAKFHTFGDSIYNQLFLLLDTHYPNKFKKDDIYLKFENNIIHSDKYLILKNKDFKFNIELDNLIYIDNNLKFIEIEVLPKIKGGLFGLILMGIIFFFNQILFLPIIFPIVAIFDFFILLFWKIPIYLIKLAIWGINFIAWFLTEVCNPHTLFSDFGTTLKTLVFSIVFAFFELIKSFIKKIVNAFGPTVMNGFWGWDQVKDSTFDENEAAYYDPKHPHNERKCYTTRTNKIPFSILLGTVIYPPLGVFMEYGLTGWVQIMICGFLTLLFYFPGLIYALICLYC